MKHIISLFLVSILIASSLLSIAFAENDIMIEKQPFSFRNSIHFGDPVDIVKQKEPLELNNATSDEDQENNITILTSVTSTLASIDSSMVEYHFTNNTLDRVDYRYRVDAKGEPKAIMLVMASDYTNIETALNEKYGAALSNDDIYASLDTSELDSAEELYSTVQLISFISNSKSTDAELKTSERVIHEKDGSVKIDHIIFRYGDVYLHSLCYQYYTSSEIKNILYGDKSPSSIKNDI